MAFTIVNPLYPKPHISQGATSVASGFMLSVSSSSSATSFLAANFSSSTQTPPELIFFDIQLGDVVVKQGETANPMYNYEVTAWPDGLHPYSDIPVDIQNTWCIDGDCHTTVWNGYTVTPTRGVNIGFTGNLKGKVMVNKGTFNSTFRLRSATLQCDVTAVGTIFVN